MVEHVERREVVVHIPQDLIAVVCKIKAWVWVKGRVFKGCGLEDAVWLDGRRCCHADAPLCWTPSSSDFELVLKQLSEVYYFARPAFGRMAQDET